MNAESPYKFEEAEAIVLGAFGDWANNPSRPEFMATDGARSWTCIVPSAELLHDILSTPLRTRNLLLVSCEGTAAAPAIVIEADAAPIDMAWEQLPDCICPIPGIVRRIRAYVESIDDERIRRFAISVFLDRAVATKFWTMPASARHHHAYPGGLALHSLEVVHDLAYQRSLTSIEHDFAIVGGLLHDIGKVWSYTEDMFQNTEAITMGHEMIGLCKLEDKLRILGGDAACMLRVLLSGNGRMRQDGSMPSSLVTRIRAADQRSCERDRGRAPGAPSLPPPPLPF